MTTKLSARVNFLRLCSHGADFMNLTIRDMHLFGKVYQAGCIDPDEHLPFLVENLGASLDELKKSLQKLWRAGLLDHRPEEKLFSLSPQLWTEAEKIVFESLLIGRQVDFNSRIVNTLYDRYRVINIGEDGSPSITQEYLEFLSHRYNSGFLEFKI
jgi:hypothetical protein